MFYFIKLLCWSQTLFIPPPPDGRRRSCSGDGSGGNAGAHARGRDPDAPHCPGSDPLPPLEWNVCIEMAWLGADVIIGELFWVVWALCEQIDGMSHSSGFESCARFALYAEEPMPYPPIIMFYGISSRRYNFSDTKVIKGLGCGICKRIPSFWEDISEFLWTKQKNLCFQKIPKGQ